MRQALPHRAIRLLAAAIVITWVAPALTWAQLTWLYVGNDVPFAADTGVQPVDCQVKSIVKIATGTRPDWSPDGRLISYDTPISTSYEVMLANPDGSRQRCVTCGSKLPKALRGKHKGKTTFNAGGKYLLFGAENEYGDHSLATTPGFGQNYDLWVTNLLGTSFWRLTRSPQGSALQSPRFSFDGHRLLWSEQYAAGDLTQTGDEFGLWKMKIADFVVTPAGPKLMNIVELAPAGPGYYEPHGFSPDGSTIIFTAMTDPTVSQFYGEIYTFNLTTHTLTKLASADGLHFEQALYAPSGARVSFMSGPFIGVPEVYKTDLYLMDADGANRVRLTYFNEPGYPEYTGADTLIDKNAWSPDGTRLVAGTYIRAKAELAVRVLSFEGPCGQL